MQHESLKRARRAALAAAALLCAHAGSAHHGAAAYDREKPITVDGVVREFRWTSPHAWILLEVPAAGAAATGAAAATGPAAGVAPAARAGSRPHAGEQWSFEGTAISVMVRNGWRSSTLHPGDRVRVLAAPRRDGTHGGEFIAVTLGDTGRTLQAGIP